MRCRINSADRPPAIIQITSPERHTLPDISMRSAARLTTAACATIATSLLFAGYSAAAPPGDNGTVKVHRSTTAVDDPRNQPKVCTFYLDGFNFDPGEEVSWQIQSWPPTGERTTVAEDTLTLDAQGHGRTTDLTLPDGHYKLFWNFTGEHGIAKHKVFWVECDEGAPGITPSPSTQPSTAPTTMPTTPTGHPTTPPPSASPGTTPTTTPTGTPSMSPSPGAGVADDNVPPFPEKPPAPEDVGDTGGGLPFTGFAGRLIAGLGAALLLGGAVAIFLSRRARGRHAGE